MYVIHCNDWQELAVFEQNTRDIFANNIYCKLLIKKVTSSRREDFRPKLSNSNWCDEFWWHFLIWWLGAGLDTFCGWLVGLSGMSSTSDVCWITSLDTRSDFAYLPVVIVLVSTSGKPTLSLSSLPAFLQPLISVRYVLLWNQLLVSFCFKFIWHWTHFCKVSFAGLLWYQSLSKGSCSIKETV